MEHELVKLLNVIKDEIADENTFHQGITNLLLFREQIFDIILQFKKELTRSEFNAMPFIEANGFHNKTIAYSIWHIFRIEDIVIHTLINKDDQIFFSEGYQRQISSPIKTTGNELIKQEIADFSQSLNLEELYQYAEAVKSSTDNFLGRLLFSDLERNFDDNDKQQIKELGVVSPSENARWLIDYWCGETIKGLILMPLSEHWMAHIYASCIIKSALR